MPGFVITAVFEVDDGKHSRGADVLAQAWGRGHRFSYCDGRMLTLVVELTAADEAGAFELALSRAEAAWQGLGYGTLGQAVTLRIQDAVEPEQVPAGIPPADGRTGKGARRRRRRKVSAELTYYDPATDYAALVEVVDPVIEDGDEPPDDGGLAGVREPRRPNPAPPGLAAARELPDAAGL